MPDLSAERVTPREDLLRQIDRSLGSLTDSPALGRMDTHRRRAFEMLADPRVRRAFDLSQEPDAVRERYGVDHGHDRSVEARLFGGLPHLGQCMLLSRRLIEAGVRLVTVVTGRRIDQAWDTHRQHFPLMRRSLCPYFDRAFSALVEDLIVRGLWDDTLVVVMGEFGRTPKLGYITSGAGADPGGRDHWPYCYTVLFGGGGVPEGLIHGASDRQAAFPSRDPVTPQDVATTLYALMGIDPETHIRDSQDRPHALTTGRVIGPLMG